MHPGAGENWVRLEAKQSVLRMIKQRNVILTLVHVARSQDGRINDGPQTKDPRVTVNQILLIPMCALFIVLYEYSLIFNSSGLHSRSVSDIFNMTSFPSLSVCLVAGIVLAVLLFIFSFNLYNDFVKQEELLSMYKEIEAQ